MRFRLWLVSLCAAILLSILSSCAQAGKIVYVNCSVATDGDGLSWATAKKTVTNGLAASVSGDEVWVSKGTYVESVTLTSGVGLYGGFAGTETTRDQRNWKTNVTVIDGNKGAWVAGVPAGATTATIIDGFTIRNACVRCFLFQCFSRNFERYVCRQHSRWSHCSWNSLFQFVPGHIK